MRLYLHEWNVALVAVLFSLLRHCAYGWDERSDVEKWIVTRLNTQLPGIGGDQGVLLRCRVRVTSGLSSGEIESRWQAVAKYPDHPDRQIIARHRQVRGEPDVTEIEAIYIDGRAWALHENRRRASMVLRAAGWEDERWMLSSRPGAQQAVFIRAWTPFPAAYNANRYLDNLRNHVGVFLSYGLNVFPRDASVADVQAADGCWSARIESPAGAYDLRGGWHGAEPIVRTITWASSGSPPSGSVWEFEDWSVQEGREVLTPQRATHKREDGLIEVYELETIDRVTRQEAKGRCGPPEYSPSASVLDFRRQDAIQDEQFASMPRVTWRQQGDVDLYALNNGSPIGMAGAAPNPSRAAWQMSWWAAVLLSATAGFVLLVVLVKRARG